MLKRWLNIKGVSFSEIDIMEDEGAYKLLVDSDRRSLPQLMINDEFIDYEEYNDILEII